jgi:hypothetical protein
MKSIISGPVLSPLCSMFSLFDFYYLHSALCSLLSALCSLISALCSLLPVLCFLLSAFCSLLSALCSLLPPLRSLPYYLYPHPRGLAAQGTVPLLLGFQIPAPGCPLVSPLGFDQEPSALLRDLGPPEEGGQDHTGGDTGGVTVPPTFHRLRSVQPQRRTRMGTPARRARRVSLPSRRVQSVSKETPQIEYMCLHLDRLTPQEMQAFICTTMQADSVSEVTIL